MNNNKHTTLHKLLFTGIIAISSCAQASASLDEIKQLANTGTVGLAIHVLEQQQALMDQTDVTWQDWEKQRIDLYKASKDWSKIAGRLASVPDGLKNEKVDLAFIQWAKTERAEALLELNQTDAARAELRYLIWKTQIAKVDPELFTRWRQLIIRSYLSDELAGDAQIASNRLQRDVPQDNLENRLMQARIAIQNKSTEQAEQLLKPYADQPQVAALLLLAKLRGQTRSPKHVLQAAYRYISNDKIDDSDKVNLWVVAAEAARQNGSRGATADALEHVIANKKHVVFADTLTHFTSDSLWNAYIDYALVTSNREQLLIGQDRAWLEVAEKIKNQKPVGARAMNAFVMLRGKSSDIRDEASRVFVTAVLKRQDGKQLLVNLFSSTKFFKKIEDMPEAVRHALVDIALAKSDIDRASELMATINAPLSDTTTDKFMWHLRRARILVLGNQPEAGAKALFELLKSNPDLPQEERDKLMQVVFDLQTAGHHEAAFKLFAKLLQQTKDDKVQRELYYWMADSQKALEQYTEAARLYMKSALHPDPENIDPWAQTAMYQAAESLAKAGLYQDAENLYTRLLNVTEDPARRATLKRQLQRLWALK